MVSDVRMPREAKVEREAKSQPCYVSDGDISCVSGPAESEDGRGPPDGGWGWVIVFVSVLCNLVVDGIIYSFGVYSHTLAEHFNASHTQVNWVGSLLAGSYLTVGPLVSALCSKYGCRKVTISGALIASVAFILSMQTDNIYVLTFMYGFIGGVGFGMIYLPAIVMTGYWFERKRAFATGIVVCGSGLGMLVFPPFVQFLVSEYTWKGTYLILAGVILNCVVFGACFRPVDEYYRQPRRRSSTVVVQRGSIMKALIEEKKRQRTISNGSLDNCIITKDNRLIKIDPSFFEVKGKNSSIIARLRESLGFSTKSLNRSKASLVSRPSILVNNGSVDGGSKTPVFTHNGKPLPPTLQQKLLQHQKVQQSQQRLVQSCGGEPVRASPSPEALASQDSGYCNSTGDVVYRAHSVDIIPHQEEQQQPWSKGAPGGVEGGHGPLATKSLSYHALNNPIISVPGVGSHIISIKVEPAESRNNLHHRRSRQLSRASSYTGSLPPSPSSLVSNTSTLSMPQYSASIQSFETLYLSQEDNKTLRKVLGLLKEMFDFNLLKSPHFLLLLLASVIAMLGFFIPYFLLPDKAKDLGMNDVDSAFVVSVAGITNTVGRVISGWIADRPWADSLLLNNLALVLAGIATCCAPLCDDFVSLSIYAAGFGLCIAMFVSLRSILLVDLLGIDKLTKSFGILILFQGIAVIAGPPVAGKLRDATGDIDSGFFLSGALIAISGLMCIPLRKLRDARCCCRKDLEEPDFFLPGEETPFTSDHVRAEDMPPFCNDIGRMEDKPFTNDIVRVDEKPVTNDIVRVEEKPVTNGIGRVEEKPVTNGISHLEGTPVTNDIVRVDEKPVTNDIVRVDEQEETPM